MTLMSNLPSAREARDKHWAPPAGKHPSYLLCNIALVNWNIFSATDIPINGSIALLGRNGAGKSVILDAIQTVENGGNQNFIALNARASTGAPEKRQIHEYCLGMMNDGQPSERPDGCLTYLMLGYKAVGPDGPVDFPEITAGLAIDARPGGVHNTQHFIIENMIASAETDAVFDGLVRDWESFKSHIQSAGGTLNLFPNSERFCSQLFWHLNRSDDGHTPNVTRLRRALKQAVEFRIEKMASVTAFTRQFVLEEALLDISVFQKRYGIWRGLHDRLKQIKAEIEECEELEKDARRARHREIILCQDRWMAHRAKYDHLRGLIASHTKENIDTVGRVEEAEAVKQRISDMVEIEQAERQRLVAILANSQPAAQIKLLEAENLHTSRQLDRNVSTILRQRAW